MRKLLMMLTLLVGSMSFVHSANAKCVINEYEDIAGVCDSDGYDYSTRFYYLVIQKIVKNNEGESKLKEIASTACYNSPATRKTKKSILKKYIDEGHCD